MGERSGEALTAANGTGRSGTDHLMERVVERGHVTGVPRLAASPQPTEPPDADPHVRWCGRGSAGEPLTPIPIRIRIGMTHSALLFQFFGSTTILSQKSSIDFTTVMNRSKSNGLTM